MSSIEWMLRSGFFERLDREVRDSLVDEERWDDPQVAADLDEIAAKRAEKRART